MDKPGRQRTIIVKVNGEEKPYTWNSDQQDVVFNEAASTNESIEDPHEWILPDTFVEVPIIEQSEQKNPLKKPSLLKSKFPKMVAIGMPITIALLLGTILGLFMLKLAVAGMDRPEVKVSPSQKLIEATDNAPVELSLKAVMVQGGVFGSLDGAEEMKETVASLGFPTSIVELDQKFYLFLGTADTLEHAKLVATNYRLKGVDAYWKEMILDGTSSEEYTKEQTELLAALLFNYKQFNRVTSAALMGIAIDEPTLKEIKSIPADGTLLKLYELNKQMVQQWDTYQGSPKEAVLTNLQQLSLDFTELYRQL